MASDTPFLGRGWGFPPTFSAGGAEVEMVSDFEDVHQSLRILLGTSPGERVMQELFGCDLSSFQFEEIDQRLLNKIQRVIADALLSHEPRVKLDRVDASKSDAEQGLVMISVHYTVRGTNSRFNMVFPFYLMEAAQSGLSGA